MSVARQVLATIEKYKMVQRGEKVLVAVSGGPDSIALLHILFRLQSQLGIELHVFHLNHKFRGEESKADARLVEQTIKQLGIPGTIEEYDVQGYVDKWKKSRQEAAREVRYELIAKICSRIGAARVAQGHHGDDLVETMLFNFLRGSGLTGLKGFLPVRDNFYIRPLINLHRRDIEDYCKRHKLYYRIDSSNKKTIYTRNQLRLELIPKLKEYNPALVDTLLRTSEVLRAEDDFLEEEAARVYSEVVFLSERNSLGIKVDEFLRHPLALKRRLLRKFWSSLLGESGNLGFEHLENLLKLLQEEKGRWEVHLPQGVLAQKKYNNLVFKKFEYECVEKIPPYCYPVKVPGEVYIPELGCTLKARLLRKEQVSSPEALAPYEVLLDYEKIAGELYVRRRLPGDRFKPLGMDGAEIKLKKFFIDQKTPKEERDKIPLVVCKDELAWVAGIRPGEKYKVAEDSNILLYLWLERNNIY